MIWLCRWHPASMLNDSSLASYCSAQAVVAGKTEAQYKISVEELQQCIHKSFHLQCCGFLVLSSRGVRPQSSRHRQCANQDIESAVLVHQGALSSSPEFSVKLSCFDAQKLSRWSMKQNLIEFGWIWIWLVSLSENKNISAIALCCVFEYTSFETTQKGL